jgi:hypothetical protein
MKSANALSASQRLHLVMTSTGISRIKRQRERLVQASFARCEKDGRMSTVFSRGSEMVWCTASASAAGSPAEDGMKRTFHNSPQVRFGPIFLRSNNEVRSIQTGGYVVESTVARRKACRFHRTSTLWHTSANPGELVRGTNALKATINWVTMRSTEG